jgi:tRNA threonylcarbamoyladenosine biosynthesis protein TsaB
VQLGQISQIQVVTGPGSFTGSRIGVSIANALALSLDIPVVGIKDGKIDLPQDSVLPYYNKNANITKAKKQL